MTSISSLSSTPSEEMIKILTTPEIELARSTPEVKLPIFSTPGSVGADIYAYLLTDSGRPNKIVLPPRTTRAIPTGLRIRAPGGAIVLSRSGLAKNSIWVANAPGLIDPDYRGELVVLLYNGGFESYFLQHEDRIAQLCIPSLSRFSIKEVEKIEEDTERGARGLGSSGR